jgi:hypothetical protein
MSYPVVLSASAVVALAGCDRVFGLTGYEVPCDLHAFTGSAIPVVAASDVARDDADLILGIADGAPFELAAGGTPQPIDLGVYVPVGLGLAPEGALLLFSGAIEPPLLQSARRVGSGVWVVGGDVPAGVYAGAPTATELGPRRTLVRIDAATADVQEYIQTDLGTWQPIGAVLEVDSLFAPNLLPNGLTMVYAGTDSAGGAAGVYAAQRAALDGRFGAPRLLYAGAFDSAVLSAQCDALTVGDPTLPSIEVVSR